jgi:hypothetical protein
MFSRTKRFIRWIPRATQYIFSVPKFGLAVAVAGGVLTASLIISRLTHGSFRIGLVVGLVIGIGLGFIILKIDYPVYTQGGDSEI